MHENVSIASSQIGLSTIEPLRALLRMLLYHFPLCQLHKTKIKVQILTAAEGFYALCQCLCPPR